jgi:hypothetical protein
LLDFPQQPISFRLIYGLLDEVVAGDKGQLQQPPALAIDENASVAMNNRIAAAPQLAKLLYGCGVLRFRFHDLCQLVDALTQQHRQFGSGNSH